MRNQDVARPSGQGDWIPKLYKVKDRFTITVPTYIIQELGLKEGDEMGFFRNGKFFSIARKSEIERSAQQPQPAGQPMAEQTAPRISEEELDVLRKLDTVRYNERTKEKLKPMFNNIERRVLQGLIKKKYVEPFKKAGEQHFKYGIAKSIYDLFLFGKRAPPASQPQAPRPPSPQAPSASPAQKKWEAVVEQGQGFMSTLESQGFYVAQNQTDASRISMELEDSIKKGLVVGIRAFNRKYYIALKSFIYKSSPKVMGALGSQRMSAPEIAAMTGIPEEGVRAVLYIMAETGDIIEVKRDVFKAV